MQIWQLHGEYDDLRGLANDNPLSVNAPIAAFVAVALYNSLELLVMIYLTVLGVVLAMIIIDAAILHTSTIVISVISVTGQKHDQKLFGAYRVMERVEITWFTIQELMISGIYIYYTLQMLSGCNTSRRRAVFYQLIIINILEIIMDVALITLQYLGIYILQMILKITVYSVKLKLEFAVLRQIVKISHVTESSGQLPDFVQIGRLPVLRSSAYDNSINPSRMRKGSGLSGHLSPLPVYFKR
ncbi:hypothetical protein KEM54_006990 [Ascosphaera aggregata]|nr:hypothetical protein KEM54_006990 [Ascosphaera aggregata]